MAQNGKQAGVIAVTDDMFFSSRIREAAKSANVRVEFMRDAEGFPGRFVSSPPSLFIVDLNSKKVDAMDVVRTIKSTEGLSLTPVVGYFSHVDNELKRRALDSGCDTVMPRSKFVRELPGVLKDARNSAS